MPASLADRLAALDRERAAFLDALAQLPPAARTVRPAPEAWSPVEIGEHVFRAERAILDGLERQLAAGDDRRDVGAYNPAAIVLLLAAMRAPKKIAVPEQARGILPEGLAFDDLAVVWAALAPRWAAAVAAHPEVLARTPLIRHPVAGGLTLADSLRFLVAHASRHRRRLARIASRA